MSRKTIGIVVLLVWVAGLGFLYNRNAHRTLEQTLTDVLAIRRALGHQR